ncbi:MAG TPA: VanZ family protein [Chthoniobacterales bacterium]|nr:VanZ family protein [Chthoniobacterales bacterium]
MKSFFKYWLPVLVWLALVFIGSTDLMSAERTSRIIAPLVRWFEPDVSAETIAQIQFILRKAAHVSEYAILAMLLWRGLSHGTHWQVKRPILFFVVWFACALFAASDEFHQSFVPSRTASANDVMIDICGALTGLAICLMFAARLPSSKTRGTCAPNLKSKIRNQK